MKKIIIISDSFKGTISSKEISMIFDKTAHEVFEDVEVVPIPIADGGEGMLDFISSIKKGEFITINTFDPYFNKIKVQVFISNGTVYIESAKIIGLTLVRNNLNPFKTSSYGIGYIIKELIKKGYKQFIIGLGGSSTNDGGCGLLSALDVKFYDGSLNEFIPTGETLNNISKIDIAQSNKLLNNIEIISLCDVDNVPYGINGASYVYAKQKGATDEMISILDNNIKYFFDLIKDEFDIDCSNLEGGGAAGAIAAGLYSLANAKLLKGIDTLLNEIKFDEILKNTDFVFSGEGMYDYQSQNGKVISGIMKYTKEYNIPLILVCGSVEKELENNIQNKNNVIFSINRKAEDFSMSKNHVKEYYYNTILNILKLIKISSN